MGKSINWDEQPLGEKTDVEIANELQEQGYKVSLWTVGRQRRERGIQAAPTERRKKPASEVKSEVLSIRVNTFTINALKEEAKSLSEDQGKKITLRTVGSQILTEWATSTYEE